MSSNNEISNVVHWSREKKVKGISAAEVRQKHQSELSENELRCLNELCRCASGSRSEAPRGDEKQAVDFALAHVFERRSVVAEHELLAAALAQRPGQVELAKLKATLRESRELIATDQGYSTQQILQAKLGLIAAVEKGKSAVAPLHSAYQPADWLSGDQKAALCQVLQSADQITGLRGLAGTGKTTVLKDHSAYTYGLLTQIRRQRRADYRRVVELAAMQETTAAFKKLERLGGICESNDAHTEGARAYLSARSSGKSALLVAPTWAEIEKLTAHVRTDLRTQGLLGAEDHLFRVFDSLSWTEAQKKDLRLYRAGQVLRFHQATGGFRHEEAVEVVRVTEDGLQVRRKNGSERILKVDRLSASFDVGAEKTLAVAVGDKLLLQANRRKRFINGELVEVKAIADKDIHLTDGRIIRGQIGGRSCARAQGC
jgi:hypothetical protein